MTVTAQWLASLPSTCARVGAARDDAGRRVARLVGGGLDEMVDDRVEPLRRALDGRLAALRPPAPGEDGAAPQPAEASGAPAGALLWHAGTLLPPLAGVGVGLLARWVAVPLVRAACYLLGAALGDDASTDVLAFVGEHAARWLERGSAAAQDVDAAAAPGPSASGHAPGDVPPGARAALARDKRR